MAALVAAVGALALAAAGCGGGGGGGGKASSGGGGTVSGLPSSCSSIDYGGSGNPDYYVVSDLPLQGAGRAQTGEMVKAIKFAIKQADWKAGKYKIGYVSCDDSTAQQGAWEPAKCTSNGQAYASTKSVIGIIGTFNSGCAELIIPIANRASDGPLAMTSPANTLVGITAAGAGAAPGEPEKYYPTGKRNYTRVVANDKFQGAADAQWAKSQGVKKVFVLNDKQVYGYGVAFNFRRAAQKLGIGIAGFQGWDAKQSSYEALANTIKQSGADSIFLGGIVCNNGSKLIKDLRAGVPNAKLYMPDGFSDPKSNGSAANGQFVSVAGQPPANLKGAGATFIKDFKAQIGATPNPYSAYGAQAMDVMLDAISRSDGTRASVTDALFKTHITNGILGDISFDKNGDLAATSGHPITIYKQQGKDLTPLKTITPPPSLVG
jgi:branched-chain amino acid transport system substrate-binding protein